MLINRGNSDVNALDSEVIMMLVCEIVIWI